MSVANAKEGAIEVSNNNKGLPLEMPVVGDTPKRPQTNFHHFRFVIIVFAGIMMGCMLCLRVNITIALLSMVNTTALYLLEHPNSTADDYFVSEYEETGEFVWNNEIQQIIISGYMLAYTIPQTFTTKLAMKYGVRSSIALSLALCSISTLLIPVISYWGWEWVLVLRLINALGASAILPSMINVIEEFMPYEDSAIGVAVFQFTCNMVSISTPLIIGFLCSIHWKWSFFVPGIVGLLSSSVWYWIASDTPKTSRFVGQKELDLICGHSNDPTKSEATPARGVKRTDLPWYFMFKIRSFYILTIIWAFCVGTMNTFFFLLPKYFDKILEIPVQDVGLLNFTVQIGALFSMLWSGPMSTFLMKQFNMSLTASRRITVSLSTSIVAITYGYLGMFHDHLVPVISMNRFFHLSMDTLILSTVMSQFGHAGVSGLVYSMMNAIGNSSTVLFCWAAGKLLDYTGETMDCWSWILYSLATLTSLQLVIYFACCHSRPVSIPPKRDEPVEDQQKPC